MVQQLLPLRGGGEFHPYTWQQSTRLPRGIVAGEATERPHQRNGKRRAETIYLTRRNEDAPSVGAAPNLHVAQEAIFTNAAMR